MGIESLSASALGNLKRRWELEALCGHQQARIESLGTDAEWGSRFVERILSDVKTLQLQQRDIFAFLVHGRQAAVAHVAPLSLVPGAGSVSLKVP